MFCLSLYASSYNSGVLRQYSFGPQIDNSSLVIRFNVAPTKGFQGTVGTKTNLRFVNTIHAGYHEGSEVDVMQMQSQVGVQLYLKFRKEAPKIPLLAFDPDFSTFVSSNVRTLPTVRAERGASSTPRRSAA